MVELAIKKKKTADEDLLQQQQQKSPSSDRGGIELWTWFVSSRTEWDRWAEDWLEEHKYNSPRRNSLIEFIMLQCRAHSCAHSPRSSSSTKGRYPAWSCRVKDIYVVHDGGGATQLGAEWEKKNPSEGRQENYYNCISVSSLLTVAVIKLSHDLLDEGTRIVVVNDRSGQQ